GGGHAKIELLGRAEIDHELEARRPGQWKVRGPGPAQDLVDEARRQAVDVGPAGAVGQEAAGVGEVAERVDRRQPVAAGEGHDALAVRERERIPQDDQALWLLRP